MLRPLLVGGGVADGILAAHLVLQFLESLVEGMLSINAEDRPPSRRDIRRSSPRRHLHTERAITTPRVNVVEAVDHSVRLLASSIA